jgi:hypothetical protein
LFVIITQQNDLLRSRNTGDYINSQDNLGNLIVTCLFICFISKTMTDTITTEDQAALPEPLDYPRDFFEPIGAEFLSEEAAAACLWSYRKDRPRRGTVDVIPADGAIMLKEIQAMRDRLRKYIRTHFMDKARQVARDVGLLMACGNRPVSPLDFKNALCALENNDENHLLVYQCCHEFHKSRTWLASTQDNWFAEENMVLLDASIDPNKRNYICSRGGFGNVARQAKSQAVQSLMQPMLQHAKWYIATTNNLRKSKTKTYDLNSVHYDEDNILHHFYVVNKIEESLGSGNAGESILYDETDGLHMAHNEDRQLIEVSSLDFHGMASILSQRLQVTVSEDALKSVFSQTHPLRRNFAGTTMVLVQNEESLTTMTSLSNNCSTSVRNMAQADMVQNHASSNIGTTSLPEGNGNSDTFHDNTNYTSDDNNDGDNPTIQQLEVQPTSVAITRPPPQQNANDRTVSPPLLTITRPPTALPPITDTQVYQNVPNTNTVIHNTTAQQPTPTTAQPPDEPQFAQPPITQPQVHLTIPNRTTQQPTPPTARPDAEPQFAQPPITQPQVHLHNPTTNPNVYLDITNTTTQPPTIPQVNVSMTISIYISCVSVRD